MLAPVRIAVVALSLSGTAAQAQNAPGALRAADSYFPAGVFSNRADIDHFLRDWYGRALVALREPPLYGAVVPPGSATWRFLWLRSFHPEIAVRLEISPTGCRVVTTVLGERPPPREVRQGRLTQLIFEARFGAIARRDSVVVSLGECAPTLGRVAAMDFWTTQSGHEALGVDGAEWILEGAESGRYHVVNRWSPDSTRDRGLRAAGLMFLQLGRAVPDRETIY